MPCDADDLISNTLVQFVRENPHPVGYVIRRGYALDLDSGNCTPCPSESINVEGFDTFCGTSSILTLSEEHRALSGWPLDFLTFGHNKIRLALIDAGRPLLDIQHPSAIYVLNSGENVSLHESNNQARQTFVKYVIAQIKKAGRPLSPSLLKEFGLT